ncbi:MAG: hypothetical protein II752_07690 [Muribaculaceae bacterium]|nr:hypothetical protein [Muribaculaceae bacterium]
MKKTLLLAAAALCAASAFAGVDDATYENQAGLRCENQWLKSLNCDEREGSGEFAALPFASSNYARTALVLGDKIYVAESRPTVVEEGGEPKTYNYATLHVFDLATGELERSTTLTNDGAPIQSPSPLCFNQIGVDNYGNVWGCGYTANCHNAPLRPYVIDLESGAVTYQGECLVPDEEENAAGRVDYVDVVGDITGVEADGILMCAPSNADAPYAYRWRRAQGENEWKGDCDDYVSLPISETYPADQAKWGGATLLTIVDDEDNTGDQFYIDDFTTAPVLYNTTGGAVDGFQNCVSLAPMVGCNGVAEFSIAERPMIAWVHNQYDKSYDADIAPAGGCVIKVGELGEGMSFENLQQYWVLPKEGLGMTSDGGNRVHNIGTYKMVDENGKEGVLLLSFKCRNGMACYLIAEEDFIYGGVDGVSADDSKVISESYYNVLGQKVINPAAGQVYVKVAKLSNGSTRSSKVVR